MHIFAETLNLMEPRFSPETVNPVNQKQFFVKILQNPVRFLFKTKKLQETTIYGPYSVKK